MTPRLGYPSIAVFFLFISCSPIPVNHGTFSIGMNRSIKSAPVVLASQLGLFDKAGLIINSGIESSSVNLMQGLFLKQYDLVCIPEYQAVVNAFNDDSFRIIAVLNRNQSRTLVMDGRSLQSPLELGFKRVGLAANSAAEYTLHRMLLFNGIPMDSVIVKHYAPDDLPSAMANGEVDAIIAWEPFTSMAMDVLGSNGHSHNAHYGRDMYWLLVTRSDITETRTEDLSALIASLDKAIAIINDKPGPSLETVSSALSIPFDSMIKEYDDYTFYIELPQSLLLAMEQEAAWYSDGSVEGAGAPDFLKLVDGRALLRALDSRVRIVGIGGSNTP